MSLFHIFMHYWYGLCWICSGYCILKPPIQPEKYGLKLKIVLKWNDILYRTDLLAKLHIKNKSARIIQSFKVGGLLCQDRFHCMPWLCVFQGRVYPSPLLLHNYGVLSVRSAVRDTAGRKGAAANPAGGLGQTDCSWHALSAFPKNHTPRPQISKVRHWKFVY